RRVAIASRGDLIAEKSNGEFGMLAGKEPEADGTADQKITTRRKDVGSATDCAYPGIPAASAGRHA
ncbi:hypothetical protein, partial [Mesorhizobium sp. M7A.F.Ca.US.003.02.1.1]|uniref:hypothetical protein n=1 Tax=Mesorhizobium sp. M7A.F.Ca.US.003.02.1.1 TaxID=2496710 RepID=UPI0019CFD814